MTPPTRPMTGQGPGTPPALHITFRSTSLERHGDSWTLYGTLTAHGQSAPLALHVVEVRQDGRDALDVRATGTVDRYAHGVTRMRAMAGRRLKLSLTAHATRVTDGDAAP
jgi:polyisoprenoid-binding protein YceI